MRPIHDLIRLAHRVRAAYEEHSNQNQKDQRPQWIQLGRRFDQVQRHRRHVEKAQAHGWLLALSICQRNLASALRACNEDVNAMRTLTVVSAHSVPSPADLLRELHHLDDEFDVVALDWKKTFLAVQTKPIVLERINLGRFSLRLHWPRLAHRADIECFEIVPLDPNTAASNDDVPHPHVKSRVLCAGEATLPLQRALEQGRLIDAFCLIRSVLETYNSGSAYVALEDWGGVSCWNCSATTDQDSNYFCEGCDHDMCSECMLSCKSCDHMRCSSCMGRCDVCNEPCCRLCVATSAISELSCCNDCLCECTECGEKVASSEFDRATERCTTCQAEPEPPEGDSNENEQTVSQPLT